MALTLPPRWERYRDRRMGGTTEGANGMFLVPGPLRKLAVMVSDGAGWEHASVSAPGRLGMTGWMEMSWVKDQLWLPEDCVMQLHPPRSQYVNDHPRTLHLWRPINREIPQPPRWMVGRYEGCEEDIAKWHKTIEADPTALDREPSL